MQKKNASCWFNFNWIVDGNGTSARFAPSGLVVDQNNNIIVADTSNNVIRKIDTTIM